MRMSALCRDSADIYRALVIRNNDIDFQQRLLEALKSHYMRSFVEHSSSAAERDQEYFCSFAVHGMLSMTNDWMESGLRETPEALADEFLRLSACHPGGAQRTGAGGSRQAQAGGPAGEAPDLEYQTGAGDPRGPAQS